jgi:hypothetical protein
MDCPACVRPVFGIGSGTPYEAATWENNVAATPYDNEQLGSNPLTRPAPAEENAGGGPPSAPRGRGRKSAQGGEGREYCRQLGGTGH